MSKNSSKEKSQRYKQILGLGKFQPKTEYVCFLPWSGEFGWYIMNHVKRFHGYNHSKKIACIKPGHECLFPTAIDYYYNWKDIPDHKKIGVGKSRKEIKNRIKKELSTKYKEITFISPEDTSWEEKTSLAHFHFIPKPSQYLGLKVDVVITPRKRKIDAQRNIKSWQKIIDAIRNQGLTVGACGHAQSSFTNLRGLKHCSWNYTDVDSDVEMIRNCKVVVTQESGLAYLTMMCEKPLFILDIPHLEIANKHRQPNVPFVCLLKLPFEERIELIKKQCKKK